MFRLALRPSPLAFALGLVLVALWALLWMAALAQVLDPPQTAARQPGTLPELTRIETRT